MPRGPSGAEPRHHLTACPRPCRATPALLVGSIYRHIATGQLVAVLDAERAAHGRGPPHSARIGRHVVRSAQRSGLAPFAVPAGELVHRQLRRKGLTAWP